MSRKKQAPKKIFYPDSKYGSLILSKFINFLMYDGKKTTAEKIIYLALDRIKTKYSLCGFQVSIFQFAYEILDSNLNQMYHTCSMCFCS